MCKLKLFVKRNLLYVLGGVLGCLGAFLDYLSGYESGSCAISSSLILSVIWSVVFGALLLGLFKRKDKKCND